jgi:Papain family cysteine protease
MAFTLNGHLPDPDDENALSSYWNFGAQLRPHLVPGAGDADLRPYASPRHDQGQTGSCVAQSVVKALENLERQEICRARGLLPSQLGPDDHKNLSVLALYYLCREQMQPSRVQEDSGTHPFLACDCLRRFGVCTEAEWPFDPSKLRESPSIMAMREAFMHKLSAYYRITETGQDRVQSVLDALRANHPVVYGTDVGDNWMTYQVGQVLQRPETTLGGHATHLVGWDNSRGVFIGENSWGTRWGEDGYYLLAPEVIADPCSRDFWVITGSWEAVHA